MIRVVCWNVARRRRPLTDLLEMDADVGLLQEVGAGAASGLQAGLETGGRRHWDSFTWVSDEVGDYAESELTDDLARIWESLEAEETPAIEVGPHCRTPYVCPFFGHCHQDEPEHPVRELPRLNQGLRDQLETSGIDAVVDIPPDFSALSGMQRRVLRCVTSGEPWVGPELASRLSEITLPASFLDFETVSPAIPLYRGTRLYQAVPFQWSLHVLDSAGGLAHRAFLDDARGDPRERFVVSLLDAVPPEGSIVTYSSYEIGVMTSHGKMTIPVWPRKGLDFAYNEPGHLAPIMLAICPARVNVSRTVVGQVRNPASRHESTGSLGLNTDFIDLLERFNRKERFYLVGEALNNRSFRLSDDFRERLRCLFGLDEPIPSGAFVAMDYHLDWIAAAIRHFMRNDSDALYSNEEIGDKRLVTGTQEDIDFLVAFEGEDNVQHLIFLEAKGFSSWDNKQMRSKAKRMRMIFGDKGDRCEGVRPYLCLVSPQEPSRLTFSDFPQWWKDQDEPYWLELKLPERRCKVTRWDADRDVQSKTGDHFKIVPA